MKEQRDAEVKTIIKTWWLVCDQCGTETRAETRPSDDRSWFRVQYQPPMSSVVDGAVIGDYCSRACVHAAAS